MTRPLAWAPPFAAYLRQAVYSGSGDTTLATSYRCE
jgi:hypothetical protein